MPPSDAVPARPRSPFASAVVAPATSAVMVADRGLRRPADTAPLRLLDALLDLDDRPGHLLDRLAKLLALAAESTAFS